MLRLNVSRTLGPILTLALLSALTGCMAVTQVTVPLEYRPKDRLEMSVFAGNLPADAKVFVAPVSDERTDKKSIGVNTEDAAKPIPVYAGVPDPATMVQEGVKRELSSAGLTVVDDQAQATRILKLGLVRFWVDETSTYRTEVRVRAMVTGKSGGPLWEGTINGTNEKFGRSHEVENYQEGFSDSTVKLVQNLLSNAGVQKALK